MNRDLSIKMIGVNQFGKVVIKVDPDAIAEKPGNKNLTNLIMLGAPLANLSVLQLASIEK